MYTSLSTIRRVRPLGGGKASLTLPSVEGFVCFRFCCFVGFGFEGLLGFGFVGFGFEPLIYTACILRGAALSFLIIYYSLNIYIYN
jgi:hypothetical protein